MQEPTTSPESSGPLRWPGCEGADPEDLRALRCSGCASDWLAHRDLAGFSIRCTQCGTMNQVPQTEQDRKRHAPPALPAPAPAAPRALALREARRIGADGGLPVVQRGRAAGRGVLEDASVSQTQRWHNATILEIILVLMALILPHWLIEVTMAGGQQLYAHPIASAIGGVLVLLIGMRAPAYAFGGLSRGGKPRYLVEAVIVAVIGVLVAQAYVAVLIGSGIPRDGEWREMVTQSHLSVLIFMVALCPGIFEEIAFRGLLQSRLSALYGLRLGLILTATAFALAHGVTIFLPIHVGLGFYLCWLRLRSSSLIPGIILHALYNLLVVLTDRYLVFGS